MNPWLTQVEALREHFNELAVKFPALELIVAPRPPKLPEPVWDGSVSEPVYSMCPTLFLVNEELKPTFLFSKPFSQSELGITELSPPDVAFPTWCFHKQYKEENAFDLGLWGFWLLRHYGALPSERSDFPSSREYCLDNLRCLQAFGIVLSEAGKFLYANRARFQVPEQVFATGNRPKAFSVEFDHFATWWLIVLAMWTPLVRHRTRMENGDSLDLGIVKDVGLASAKLITLLLQAPASSVIDESMQPPIVPRGPETFDAEVKLAGCDQLLPLYRFLEPRRTWASHREIADYLNVAEGSVAKYLRRLAEAGVKLERDKKLVMLKRK